MYALIKFQPDKPTTLGAIVLQSCNSEKIDLYWTGTSITG